MSKIEKLELYAYQRNLSSIFFLRGIFISNIFIYHWKGYTEQKYCHIKMWDII